MATIIVSRGRNVIVGRAYNTAEAYNPIQSLSVDDQSSGFLDTDEDLDRAGGLTVANSYVVDFDSTPTLNTSTNQVTSVATVPAGQGNFTIRRIAHHNAAAASVTVSSNTLVSGVDGFSFTKTSDFSALFRKVTTQTDAS